MRRQRTGLARVSSAAVLAARHPTSGTTRETHRASRRTPPATGPARSGMHAAYGVPRRHTMPSAQAVGKRGGGAGRTSVSQSVRLTGHFVRLHLRPLVPRAEGAIGEFFRGNGAPGRIRTCDPRLRRPMLYPTELRASWMTIGRARTFSRYIRMAQQRSRCSLRPAWSSAKIPR